MHAHLDPVGGIAGDMFIAAALDAYPEWEAGLREAIAIVGLPTDWFLELNAHKTHAIAGKKFNVRPPSGQAMERAEPTGTFRDIRARIEASILADSVKKHAVGIFTVLAEAEAKVHGIEIDRVHFHELADWDSVADIVGAAWLLAQLNASWSVGVIPLGGGEIETSHGPLPVPAPATALLLRGFETIDDGIGGERVTPTGAAILNYLQPSQRNSLQGKLIRSGFGLGTRELPGRANMLRLLAWETQASTGTTEQIGVITFEIDDQTGEDLAVALDHLRATDGVVDVLQIPAFGKKGRLTTHIQILCTPTSIEVICERCLLETTTLGLRWRIEQRQIVAREAEQVSGLPIKTATRPGGIRTAKAEVDAVRELSSHAERERERYAAEQNALAKKPAHDSN